MNLYHYWIPALICIFWIYKRFQKRRCLKKALQVLKKEGRITDERMHQKLPSFWIRLFLFEPWLTKLQKSNLITTEKHNTEFDCGIIIPWMIIEITSKGRKKLKTMKVDLCSWGKLSKKSELKLPGLNRIHFRKD